MVFDAADRWVMLSTGAGLVGLCGVAFALLDARGVYRCPSRERATLQGADTILVAAGIALDLEGDETCPTIGGLVRARYLDRAKSVDAWGVPYRIRCFGSPLRIRVASSGPDRESATVDDIVVVSPVAPVAR